MKKEAEKVLKDVNKQFGKDTLISGKDREKLKIEWHSTGLLSLDLATKPNSGSGGIPKGRIIEIFGPESAGKTTIALSTIAEVQKNDGLVAFFDVEQSYNPQFADIFGVKTDEIVFSKECIGETVLDTVEAIAKSGKFDLIVLDSVASLPSGQVIKESNEQDFVALEPRMWSQAMKKLTQPLSDNDCSLILINQIREDPSTMYGNPETTPGGHALEHHASMRIRVWQGERYKEKNYDGDKEQIGHEMRIKIEKNKVGTKGGRTSIDLHYEKGFNLKQDLINAGIRSGVIEKNGGWLGYTPEHVEYKVEDKEEIKENGMANFLEEINSQPNSEWIMKEIRHRIWGLDITEFEVPNIKKEAKAS